MNRQKFIRLGLHAMIIILSWSLIFGSVQPVIALTKDELNSIYSDTVWYKPGGSIACGTTLLGSNEAEQAWNYFKSSPRSLSDVQTAAILGNLKRESGINPQRVQNTKTPEGDSDVNPLDGRTGYGIAQWTNLTRQQNLSKYAQQTNRPVSSLDLQLDFIFQEMNGGPVWNNLKQINEIDEATVYVEENYEGSADLRGDRGMAFRIRGAIGYYNLYSGTTPIADPSPGEPICDAGAGEACTTGDILGWQLSGSCRMVSYDQGDPKWASLPYGKGKSPIEESGCGPTSLAMIGATFLNDATITPATVASRYGDKYHIAEGTSWALFPVYAQDTGLKFKELGTDLNAAAEIIRGGGLVLMSVDPGYFTSTGHLMVIRAISQDGTLFYLADSNGKGRNGDSETRPFSADFLRSSGSMQGLWGYSK